MLQVIREAGMPGEERSPSELISKLNAYTEPLSIFSDPDATNGLFHALQSEFGLVALACDQWTPPAEVRESWVNLLRWLIRELREWRKDSDPDERRLIAIFTVAQFFAIRGGLWSEMPVDIGSNHELIARLANFVTRLDINFQTPDNTPIWEREDAQSLVDADASKNWRSLRKLWTKFRYVFRPMYLSSQIVGYLAHYDMPSLVASVSRIRKSAIAMQVVGALDTLPNFKLALETDNEFIQFSVIYHCLVMRQAHDPGLDSAEQLVLSNLLTKVCRNSAQWRGLMAAFNDVPLPHMQEALGAALATASESALSDYVNSLRLYASDAESRSKVAVCLRSFRNSAEIAQRKRLWTLAFQRWNDWNFALPHPKAALSEISGCALDYALVGYALECLTATQRKECIEHLSGQLRHLDLKWHASSGDFLTDWNRLLSRCQPYAHASAAEGNDWDWLYRLDAPPLDLQGGTYLEMMLRVR